MNWGKGLAIFISLFLATIFVTVFFAMRQTNEMIDENYYQKEEVYQKLIDSREAFRKALNGKPFILDSVANVYFRFPKSTYEADIYGKIEFLKIDNQKLDTIFYLKSPENGIKVIPKSLLKIGRYKVRATWEVQKKAYYYEATVDIKK